MTRRSKRKRLMESEKRIRTIKTYSVCFYDAPAGWAFTFYPDSVDIIAALNANGIKISAYDLDRIANRKYRIVETVVYTKS